MEVDDKCEKWYFSREQLANTPSRKCGYDSDRELSCRQQAANFIQDMGQRLHVTQLCINTAIVYMHRFYVFHSFTRFHRNAIAAAALFLAAKVEEQPRKLEHVIKVAQMCLHRETTQLDTKSEQYMDQAHDLVVNENVLLQTLGFDVAIDHPHTHVVKCCHLVKASKDLAQTSYFMASNSLHLTTMCLQYKPTVVACFCIHLACKWSNWEIPLSNESKSWFWYVDKSVSQELLEQLTDEFLRIFDKCPSRLKRKISANQNMTGYVGVNVPGSGGGDAQNGVSFQQPIARNRNPAIEDRKKQDGNPAVQNHRHISPQDVKKHPAATSVRDAGYGTYPPAQTSNQSNSIQNSFNQATFNHDSTSHPSFNQSSFTQSNFNQPHYNQPNFNHSNAGQSNANQIPFSQSGPSQPNFTQANPMQSGVPSLNQHGSGAQFHYPPHQNILAQITNGPVSRPPNPPQTKHTVRPETMFPPPKRNSHNMGPPTTRPVRQEFHNPPTQPSKNYSQGHHVPRNGTSLTHENVAQPPIKSESVSGKYPPPTDKYSKYQKPHHISFDRGNQPAGGGWSSNDPNTRNASHENKYGRKEVTVSQSYHSTNYSLPQITSSIPKHLSPASLPTPAPPLPPLPPPPPPPPPVHALPTKPSSIFSPDKATPPLHPSPSLDSKCVSPLLLSPISSNKSGRHRTSSSSSEPELIPVMPKIEEMSGFESLARGKTAIKLPGKPSSKREVKHQESLQPKEPPPKEQHVSHSSKVLKPVDQPALPVVEKCKPVGHNSQPAEVVGVPEEVKREHKKKKKHKEHREHKERDGKEKDKKKDKHKDKHREKDKEKQNIFIHPEPIKIKIPKDKIPEAIINQEKYHSIGLRPEPGLKIKIPRDKLKPTSELSTAPSSLKIKISKDAISQPSTKKSSSSGSSSKKRERRESDDGRSSHTSKHPKLSKSYNGDYKTIV